MAMGTDNRMRMGACRGTRITGTTMPDMRHSERGKAENGTSSPDRSDQEIHHDNAAGAALLKLMAWLSPAFPVGSFSYSHGLERAVDAGSVADATGLENWIADLIEHGSGWNDAVLFAEAWRRGSGGHGAQDLAELGIALAGSAERLLETSAQGNAFATAMTQWGEAAALPAHCPYSVAVGLQAGAARIACEPALGAFLQAFAGNLLQAGIRLGVLGQTGAVASLSRLGPLVLKTAARAARSTTDDIGSSALAAEIASMRHETQYSRLFRT